MVACGLKATIQSGRGLREQAKRPEADLGQVRKPFRGSGSGRWRRGPPYGLAYGVYQIGAV